jgi:hypothetical protein
LKAAFTAVPVPKPPVVKGSPVPTKGNGGIGLASATVTTPKASATVVPVNNTVNVYIGKEKLDQYIDYRIDVNSANVATTVLGATV